MLYDVHTHIGLDTGFFLRGWWPYAATAQDLLQHMHAHGIGRAACFPFCLSSAYDAVAFADRGTVELLPGRVPYDRENPLLAQELGYLDLDHRLHMLAMFDPERRVREQVANLEKLRSKFTGLKVQGTIIQSHIAALLGDGRPLMEFAEAHRLPVLIHTSISDDDLWSQVADCIKVARAFPRARFNLAHSLRFHAPSLREVVNIPNVWVDCSAHLVHCELARIDSGSVAPRGQRVDADYSKPAQVLAAIHEMLGGTAKSKYLWGSDNPYMSWCDDTFRAVYTYAEEVKVLRELLPEVQKSIGTTGPEAWLLGK